MQEQSKLITEQWNDCKTVKINCLTFFSQKSPYFIP